MFYIVTIGMVKNKNRESILQTTNSMFFDSLFEISKNSLSIQTLSLLCYASEKTYLGPYI